MTPNGSVDLYHNDANKLQTKADGVNITGELECDSLDVDGNVDFDGGQVTFNATSNTLNFVDDAKARFGTSNDLQIYHDGSNSHITDSGTGVLIVGSNSFQIKNAANSEMMAKFVENGEVELRYDHQKKFETTVYGVDVTGTAQSDTLIVTGVSTVASLIFSAGTNTNGVAYFDANGQVQSTVAPASGISTSNSILTTNASGVPIWTDTIDCGTF